MQRLDFDMAEFRLCVDAAEVRVLHDQHAQNPIFQLRIRERSHACVPSILLQSTDERGLGGLIDSREAKGEREHEQRGEQ